MVQNSISGVQLSSGEVMLAKNVILLVLTVVDICFIRRDLNIFTIIQKNKHQEKRMNSLKETRKNF